MQGEPSISTPHGEDISPNPFGIFVRPAEGSIALWLSLLLIGVLCLWFSTACGMTVLVLLPVLIATTLVVTVLAPPWRRFSMRTRLLVLAQSTLVFLFFYTGGYSWISYVKGRQIIANAGGEVAVLQRADVFFADYRSRLSKAGTTRPYHEVRNQVFASQDDLPSDALRLGVGATWRVGIWAQNEGDPMFIHYYQKTGWESDWGIVIMEDDGAQMPKPGWFNIGDRITIIERSR